MIGNFEVTIHFGILHLLEKWHHFVNPKTFLCFRVKGRVRIRVRNGVSGNTFL